MSRHKYISEPEFAAMVKRAPVNTYVTRDIIVNDATKKRVRGGTANRHDKVERHSRGDTSVESFGSLDRGKDSPMRKVSGSELSPRQAPSPYKSKWESAYAAKLELEKQAGIIKAFWYEPFSLWLPGKVRYKPDFLVQYNLRHGEDKMPALEVVEVKGWSRNRRDGMTRLKVAAAVFPCFTWRLVYRTKGGGFDGEYV